MQKLTFYMFIVQSYAELLQPKPIEIKNIEWSNSALYGTILGSYISWLSSGLYTTTTSSMVCLCSNWQEAL